jgi:O-antigen/teichoic acid export membrane protein
MLLRHSAYYLLARGVPGFINFAALAIYTRLLAPEEFGYYALVLVGVGFVNVVVFQWLRLVLARFLPAHREAPERFLGGMLALFLLLAVGVTGIGALLALWWPDPVWRRLLALAVPLLLAQAWFELNLTLATTRLKPGWYGRLLGTKSAISLVIGGLLAWIGLGALAPLVGLLVAHLLAFLLFAVAVWRGISPQWPEASELRKQLRYGLPLTVTFALGWVVTGSDRLLIAWLLDESSVGLYAAGYDLAFQSLTLLLAVINTAAYPLAVTAMERGGNDAASGQMAQNGQLIFTVAFAGCAGLIALGPEIVTLMIGAEFRSASLAILPWVACAAAIAGIKAYHYDLAFQLSYASFWQVVTGAVAAIANVALNFILIPNFGIVGAAWATLAAFLIAAFSSALLGSRVFAMPRTMPLLVKATVVGIAVWSSAWFGASWSDAVWTSLIQGFMLGGVAAALMSLVLNVGGLRAATLKRKISRSPNGN